MTAFFLQEVKCSTMCCDRRVEKPFGHSHCREHARCGKKSVLYGLYWVPEECTICCDMLYAATDDEPNLRALEDLRAWVKGFARATKPKGTSGPKVYLPSERMRVLLFPGADCRTVVGVETSGLAPDSLASAQGESGEAGGLLAPSAPPPVEGMDLEESPNPPSLSSVSASGPSGSQGSAPPDQAFFLQLMSQLKEMKDGQERLSKKVAEIAQAVPGTSAASTSGGVSDPSLPETPDTNPWKPCEWFYLKHGVVHMGHLQYSVDQLEFHPNIAMWPNCYCRFRDSAFTGLKIPQETVLLSHTEANALVAKLANCMDHSTAGKGSCGSSDPVFVADGSVVPPFMGKITKAVLESLEGRKEAYKGLKETKPFSLLVPSKSDTFPEFEDFFSIFQGGDKLASDVGDIQLKESFPKLTKALIDAEHKARIRLGSSATLQMVIETAQLMDKDFPLAALMAKLHASEYGDALDAFVKAKRECRRHVVGRAKNDHDAKSLIASSCFCSRLFPEDKVKEILDLAQRDNKTLRVKWQMPEGSSASPGASTPSRGSKRKGNWSQLKGKRGAAFTKGGTPNYIRSPASQPGRESPQSGRGRGKGRGGYKGQTPRGRGGKATETGADASKQQV